MSILVSQKTLVILFVVVTEVVYAQPKIAVRGNTSFEFGNVYQGATPTHDVTIVNEGTEPLMINHVNSPCNCTSTYLRNSTIAPKDSSLLTITFNSKDFIDSVRKYVLIVSNDLVRRNFFIHYSVNVISLIRVTPSTVSFGEVRLSEHVTQTVSLENISADTVRVQTLSAPGPYLESSMTPVVLIPGQIITVTMTFTPSQEKLYNEQATLELENKVQPKVFFRFSARGISK